MRDQGNWPEQLFVLSDEAIESMEWKDVSATAEAMKEAGVWKPPYNKFAILATGKHFLSAMPDGRWEDHGGIEAANAHLKGSDIRIHVRDANEDSFGACLFVDMHDGSGFVEVTDVVHKAHKEAFENTMNAANMMLRVLLATRNAKKTTIEDKLVRLGIGKGKKRFRYTTTITVGTIDEREDGSPVGHGEPRRPHFRRGHVRRQKYGPGWQFERIVFIEAVFVNADREWVGERDHYNVRMGK